LREVRFLHCADIHLDAPFTSLGASSDKASARRREVRETFGRIIDAAKFEKADLLLISGDLYEHGYVKKSTITYINDRFREIPNVKVIILPGNHDPYVPNSCYRSMEWSENVTILSESKPYEVIDELGMCVHGAGFNSSGAPLEFKSGQFPIDNKLINVLMLHGTIDMNVGRNICNPASSKELSSLGVDYVALGHFHNRLDDIGGRGVIYNPGSPEPLGFDEPGAHGIFAGSIKRRDSGEVRRDIRFVRLNKRAYASTDVNVDGLETDEQITGKILERLESVPPEALSGSSSNLFRVTLKGYLPRDFKADLKGISEYLGGRFFFIWLNDETEPDYDLESVKDEPGLRGLFVRKLAMLEQKTDDEQKRRLLRNALYYGLQALEKGEVEL